MPRDYKLMAELSHKAWEANGRKPRGFSSMTPEQRRAAAARSHEARRKRKEHEATASEHERER